MTPTEAKKVLDSAGYLPGRDRTDGLEPEARANIKAAISTLKAAGKLADYIASAGKPKKKATAPKPESEE